MDKDQLTVCFMCCCLTKVSKRGNPVTPINDCTAHVLWFCISRVFTMQGDMFVALGIALGLRDL